LRALNEKVKIPKKIYGENLEMLEGMKQKILDQYREEGEAIFCSARLWDDGIIDPKNTRKILGECLNIISDGDKRELKPNTFGVARM
jgi:geranyl-CoA carboxylase beta subunit